MPDFVELQTEHARLLDRFVHDGQSIPELAIEFDMSETAIFVLIDKLFEYINDRPWTYKTPPEFAEARISFMERLHDRLKTERDLLYLREAQKSPESSALSMQVQPTQYGT